MDRLERLMAEHLDGRLTVEELAELSRALEEHPAAAVEFADLFQQSRALEALHNSEDQAAVDAIMADLRDGPDCFVRDVMDQLAEEAPARRQRQPLWRLGSSRWLNFSRWALVAGSAAFLIGCVWLLVPIQSAPRITRLDGNSSQVHRHLETLTAVEGMVIKSGDVIETGRAGAAVVSFDGERTSLQIAPASRLEIRSWSRGKRLGLSQGTIEATVARQYPFHPLVIKTPNASARVMGTQFVLTVTTNRTELNVMAGIVRLADAMRAGVRAVDVRAGYWATVASDTELSALPRTGSILREYWTNIPGAVFLTFLYTNANFPNRPSGSEFLDHFETPSDWGDNFGDRLRGYLVPPQTGDYSFWIAGKDGAELWLSRDSNSDNKVQVAFTKGSPPGEWDQAPAQGSATLHLTAGRLYYIEAARKCGVGEDHLAVAWQPPGGQREVIPGRYLAPFKLKRGKQTP